MKNCDTLDKIFEMITTIMAVYMNSQIMTITAIMRGVEVLYGITSGLDCRTQISV